MKIYLACGLTHVPRACFEPYVAFIHHMASFLEVLGAEVKYALKDSDPQLASLPTEDKARLCYLWDRRMVEWADLVVAECTYPSTGVGIELQIAERNGTPTIICFQATHATAAPAVEYLNPDGNHYELQIGEGHVTLMALGLPTVFLVIPYVKYEEAIRGVGAAVSDRMKAI